MRLRGNPGSEGSTERLSVLGGFREQLLKLKNSFNGRIGKLAGLGSLGTAGLALIASGFGKDVKAVTDPGEAPNSDKDKDNKGTLIVNPDDIKAQQAASVTPVAVVKNEDGSLELQVQETGEPKAPAPVAAVAVATPDEEITPEPEQVPVLGVEALSVEGEPTPRTLAGLTAPANLVPEREDMSSTPDVLAVATTMPAASSVGEDPRANFRQTLAKAQRNLREMTAAQTAEVAARTNTVGGGSEGTVESYSVNSRINSAILAPGFRVEQANGFDPNDVLSFHPESRRSERYPALLGAGLDVNSVLPNGRTIGAKLADVQAAWLQINAQSVMIDANTGEEVAPLEGARIDMAAEMTNLEPHPDLESFRSAGPNVLARMNRDYWIEQYGVEYLEGLKRDNLHALVVVNAPMDFASVVVVQPDPDDPSRDFYMAVVGLYTLAMDQKKALEHEFTHMQNLPGDTVGVAHSTGGWYIDSVTGDTLAYIESGAEAGGTSGGYAHGFRISPKSVQHVINYKERVDGEVDNHRVVNTSSENGELPGGYSVEAFPNPFVDRATVQVEVPHAQVVRVEVYDMNGRLLSVPFSDYVFEEGPKEIPVDGTGWAAGMYLVRIITDKGVATRKLAHVK